MKIQYFEDSNVQLNIEIHTSTANNETASDAGDSMGGRWSSHFIGRGITTMGDGIEHGKELFMRLSDGTEVIQTTQTFRLIVMNK